MASMNFGHRDIFAFAAQVVNFQNMEANAGSNRSATSPFFACLMPWRRFPGTPAYSAPAHLAAVQRLLVGKTSNCQLTEIRALLRA
ncbi:hypothetical protein ACLK1S_00340 [Escherichia coli]